MRYLLSILTPATNGGAILQRSGSLGGPLSQMVVLWCLCKSGVSLRGIKYIFHFFSSSLISLSGWLLLSFVFTSKDLWLSY